MARVGVSQQAELAALLTKLSRAILGARLVIVDHDDTLSSGRNKRDLRPLHAAVAAHERDGIADAAKVTKHFVNATADEITDELREALKS